MKYAFIPLLIAMFLAQCKKDPLVVEKEAAYSVFNKEDFAAALPLLETIYKKGTDDFETVMRLAVCMAKVNNNLLGAQEFLDKYLEMHPLYKKFICIDAFTGRELEPME
ncbi:MAG: hypothetical protein ABIA63_04060 [bacterium]